MTAGKGASFRPRRWRAGIRSAGGASPVNPSGRIAMGTPRELDGDDDLVAIARDEVGGLVSSLPDDVRLRADEVRVVYELDFPSRWEEEGIEPDSLGLFSGPSYVDYDHDWTPEEPLVSLFLRNLWDYSDRDEEIFREEVRRTYLHELGHYLGLEEEDMEERDLS